MPNITVIGQETGSFAVFCSDLEKLGHKVVGFIFGDISSKSLKSLSDRAAERPADVIVVGLPLDAGNIVHDRISKVVRAPIIQVDGTLLAEYGTEPHSEPSLVESVAGQIATLLDRSATKP